MINGLMGKWLKLEQEDINNLVMLGLIHDVGKTKISEEIMNTPGMLPNEDFESVKKHAQLSYDILKNNNNFDKSICQAALHHHERMNGSGYPGALTAEAIPVYARITAVSDVYDAMISKRSYKSAQSPFMVLRQLKEERFWGLDIRFVNVFTEYMPKELLGKSVLMSNGMAGIVKHINDRNIEYPIVEVNGEVITTDRDLYCLSMIIDD
jgi:HD-GYP domain-containing protein (c-di-GMP phosphodiesterase class II)